jgi:hypothetical protein
MCYSLIVISYLFIRNEVGFLGFSVQVSGVSVQGWHLIPRMKLHSIHCHLGCN